MKNLHLIPTDKPSRVYKHLGRELKHTVRYFEQKGLLCINQNIYITSDEEIKEGDWCYAILSKQVFKNANPNLKSEDKKKIILTTDQDLIADGVQAIDDTFLEWFVKNPSCDNVEVDKNWNYPLDKSWEYKLRIIPQEEPKQYTNEELEGFEDFKKLIKPKQETLEPIVYNIGDNIRIINPTENQPKLFTTHKVDNNFGVVYYYQLDGKEESIGFSYIKKEEPKQETLEEFINSQPYYGNCTTEYLEGIEEGAKWQAKRMYTEEQVKKAYEYGSNASLGVSKTNLIKSLKLGGDK